MFTTQLAVQVALHVAFGVVGLLAYLAPGVAQAHLDAAGRSGRMNPGLSLLFALGLLVPFLVVGTALAVAGTFITAPRLIVTRVAALAIAIVALLQLVPARTGLLQRTVHFAVPSGSGPSAALLTGARQMVGWSPLLTPAALAPLVFATSVHDLASGCLAVGAFSVGMLLSIAAGTLAGSKGAERLRDAAWRIRHGVHLAGVILLVVAFMVLTGWMNGVTGYLTPFTTPPEQEAEQTAEAPGAVALETPQSLVAAPDFELADQWGGTESLADLQGSIVVLTFWSTESHAAVSAVGGYQSF